MGKKLNLINGTFITMDDHCSEVHSVTITNGKIIGLNTIESTWKTINLNGAIVIPGFVDAHFHLVNLGKQLDTLQLKECNSPKLIADMVYSKSKEILPDDWIIGFGWDHNKWKKKEYPTAKILNNLSINNPVMLTRVDGHSCWVNQSAIDAAKIDIFTESPQGGKIINNCILVDNAMNPLQDVVPKPDETTIKKWIRLAVEIIKSRGITNIHDAWQDPTTINVLKEMEKEQELPIRVYGMLGSSYSELLDKYFSVGHYQSKLYTIRAVKAFIDGALGSRGAALLEPYCDDKNNCGLILISEEEFKELAHRCGEAGFQLCTHAIGDMGNRMVLDVYSNSVNSKTDHRWRIEHAQMVCDEDIPRFAENGIVPSMQPSHCTSDMPWLEDRLGSKRLHRISRWKTFIDSGCRIPGGSDCPIEEGNPLFEFYAAVTRRNHKGLPAGGWQNQETVNRIDALKMFTSWAAFGEFAELRRGKINVGYDADLTVLSQDITACSYEDILKTEVLMTIVNGEIVYSKMD